jgi:C-terminal processing protease CtpA/Prc
VQFTAEGFVVDALVAGGGAEKCGVAVGDRVIAVEGVAIAKLSVEATITKIRGPAGTMVALTMLRNGAQVAVSVERKDPRDKPKKKLSLDFGDMSEVLERKISP